MTIDRDPLPDRLRRQARGMRRADQHATGNHSFLTFNPIADLLEEAADALDPRHADGPDSLQPRGD